MFGIKLPYKAAAVIAIGLLQCSFATASQVIIPAPPKLGAEAYVLMDADTGKVLVEHNAKTPMPPASITKMMTSYIVSQEIQAGRLKETDLVRISDDAWQRGGAKSGSSTMFLNPRSEVPVIDLLRGVIVQSGNDASIALAQHVAGSESAFADVMNQKAALLGMQDTHFLNATGWPEDGHMSTAHDLALLSRALIQNHPKHYAIYAEKYFNYNGINQPNRNKLLFTDKYVDGIKTGHTEEAGYGLVASSLRDDMRLIAVVLKTNSERQRASEAQQLLSYGFRYYKTHKLYRAADVVTSTKVWHGVSDTLNLGLAEDIVATIPRGSQNNLNAVTEMDSVIKAPIQQGDVLGKLVVKLDDEIISQADLVALESIDEAGFFSRTWDSIRLMINGPESE